MFGDSLTAGYGLRPEQALPARLEAALRAQGRIVVLNHGVPGNTTADGLARIDLVLADKPDIVLVGFGSNDLFGSTDPDEVERNLVEFITRFRAANVTVWLAGMRVPRNLGWKNLVKVAVNSLLESFSRPPICHAQTLQYAAKFNVIYERVAAKLGAPLYPFLLDGVTRYPSLYHDVLHPNAKGVDVIVGRMLPFVTANLDDYVASLRSRP